jgi:hypothetical protein
VAKVVVNAINKLFFYFFIVVLFSGCCALKSPLKRYECNKERAEEKIIVLTKKFPELIQTPDTIRLMETITIPTVQVDTTFVFNTDFLTPDTVILEREKVKIKYIRKDSLVYITADCIGDTIYVEKEIPVEKIVVQKPPLTKSLNNWLWTILLLVAGYFGLRGIIKRWLF